VFTVGRVTEQDWRSWREIRLAALADAPDAFAGTFAGAEVLADDKWREMARTGAIFIAAAGGGPAGVAAAGGPASVTRPPRVTVGGGKRVMRRGGRRAIMDTHPPIGVDSPEARGVAEDLAAAQNTPMRPGGAVAAAT
jgi:hypothetical protein